MKGWHFAIPTPTEDSGLGDLGLIQLVRMDWTPVPLEVEMEPPLLTLRKTTRDYGSIHIPYRIANCGEVPIPLTQLMQRDAPYRLIVELARGQLNQARHCVAEATLHGFQVEPALRERLWRATREFGRAVRIGDEEASDAPAATALRESLGLAEEVILAQCEQALDNADEYMTHPGRLACALDDSATADEANEPLKAIFGHVYIGQPWAHLEGEQGEHVWDSLDRQVHWAVANHLPTTLGPVVDFSSGLPSWLQTWSGDHETLLTLLIDRIESVMGRYRDCVSRWLVVGGVNSAEVLGLTESKMLWLTKRLVEAARSMDPSGELLVGIDQPWGDYVARTRRVYCPATFIDTLLRAQTGMNGIALELAMGFDGGSGCRTFDAMAQLLSHFSEFGLPLDVLLAFGSTRTSPTAGQWRTGFDESTQALWAANATKLCLAHGTVKHAVWSVWRDAPGMRFPSAGLFDPTGKPKAALAALGEVRRRFLR